MAAKRRVNSSAVFIACILSQAFTVFAQSTVQTWNLPESYGTRHFPQPFTLPFTGGPIRHSDHRMLGPNGQEIAWQQLTNGNILVEGRLAKTVVTPYLGVLARSGNSLQLSSPGENVNGELLFPINTPFYFHFSVSAPTGMSNDTVYFIKTTDLNNSGLVTVSATPGGATLTLTSGFSGDGTATVTTGTVTSSSGLLITEPAHQRQNGDLIYCTAGGSPGNLTCDGATPYYVRDVTTDTYRLATSYNGSAIAYSSAGTGVLSIITNWTWTLQSGVASTVTATNPVAVVVNGSNWEMTNGLTGARVPTTAGNGSPFNKAPIQQIRFSDGTWSTQSSLLYEPNTPGDVASPIQTAAYSPTSYKATLLESGPLATTIQASWVTNRPQYEYSGIINVAGIGHCFEQITLYANQPVIRVTQPKCDMEWRWFLNLYPDLADKPDIMRWRGGAASTIPCGHNLDGTIYLGANATFPFYTPAYRDLAYASDVPAGINCSASSNKRQTAWNPNIPDSGWNQFMYNDGAASSAPLIGTFAGQASLLQKVAVPDIASMPGVFTSDNWFVTSAAAGGFEFNNGIWFGATDISSDYFIYVSTKTNLAADGVEQPIAQLQNALSGINMTSILNYAPTFADPPGGFTSLYMPSAILSPIRDKVVDGTSACGSTDCYYNKVSTANGGAGQTTIVDMWHANTAGAIDTALNSSLLRLSFMAFFSTQVDGVTHGSNIALNYSAFIVPMVALFNTILIDPNLTAAQKATVKAYDAYISCMTNDNDYVPLDNNPGEGIGTPNQNTQLVQSRTQNALALPSHPYLAPRQAIAKAAAVAGIAAMTNASGSLLGTTWYQGASTEPVVFSLANLNTNGTFSFAGQSPLLNNIDAEMHSMTPPEVRFGTPRKAFSDGEGNTFGHGRLGMYATNFAGIDTTRSQQSSWMWDAMNTSAHLSHDSGSVPTILGIDDGITKTDPALTSKTFPGGFSSHRHGWGTVNETALRFINGTFYDDHRHPGDYGQVSMYALKAPLALDMNGNLYYPNTLCSLYHNVVSLDSATGVTWSADNPPLECGTSAYTTSTVTQFLAFPHVTRTVATFSGGGETWTRALTSVAANPAFPVIGIKDSFTDTVARTFTLNMLAKGAVTTPVSPFSVTPTARAAGICLTIPSQLPSNGTVYNLTSGIQHFPFTGADWVAHPSGGIDWDLYTNSSVTSQQFLIGDYKIQCQNGIETTQYKDTNSAAEYDEDHYIFRLHDTGPFDVHILPVAKSGGSTGTASIQACGFRVIRGSETTCQSETEVTWTNGTAKLLASFDTNSHTASNITLTGLPGEVYMSSATAGTYSVSSLTAGTGCIDLSAFGGTWYASRPVTNPSTNKFCLYNAGADATTGQPTTYTVTLSTTSGTRRVIPLQSYAASGYIYWRFGSASEFVGAVACSGECTLNVLSPSGSRAVSQCKGVSSPDTCGGSVNYTVP